MSADGMMGVKLTIGRWSGRKFDRDVSDQTTAGLGAQEGSVRANKLLLPKYVFKAINSAYNGLRTAHMMWTLPWGDDDTRALTTKAYFPYMEAMRDRKEAFDVAADDFVQRYPELVQQAPSWLQGGFREEDYPRADEIRTRFYVDLAIQPIPTAGDFRIDLGDDEVQRIRAQITERNEIALAEANRAVWDRVHNTLSKLLDSLSRDTGNFHESLVGNVAQLTTVLSALNVTDDPQLEKARKEIESQLNKIDVGDVRKDKDYKADKAKEVNALLERMKQYGAM